MDVRFGDSQFQVMYQGNLNLVDIIKNIPGLSDFNFSGLTLNVQNPSITILNPGRNAEFSFKTDKLPIADLQNWLITKAGNTLPQVAKDILNIWTNYARTTKSDAVRVGAAVKVANK